MVLWLSPGKDRFMGAGRPDGHGLRQAQSTNLGRPRGVRSQRQKIAPALARSRSEELPYYRQPLQRYRTTPWKHRRTRNDWLGRVLNTVSDLHTDERTG